jgi:hypothetical protein
MSGAAAKGKLLDPRASAMDVSSEVSMGASSKSRGISRLSGHTRGAFKVEYSGCDVQYSTNRIIRGSCFSCDVDQCMALKLGTGLSAIRSISKVVGRSHLLVNLNGQPW